MASERSAALVTGASRGLGAAIARRLAAHGWAVAVNYRSSERQAQQVVDSIRRAGGVADALGADVTDETEVADLVEETADRLGPVEVVVANATGPQPAVPIDDLTWEAHLDQLRFFVKSPTLLLGATLPGMTARGRGRVIHIGSDAIARAQPAASHSAAAKAAQLALTRAWARGLGARGITVNMVAPGWIPVERHTHASADALRRYRADVPVGRMGVPDDVAGVVAFLASDDAAFITGQLITVNGGHTLG
jgi:3-oxoacyl-[acyl-carrier protein] reductase